MKTVKQLFCSFFCYYYIIQGGGRRSLTEDLMDLDGARGDESSVSCADSSFAKGAIGAFGRRKSVAGIFLKFHGDIKFFLCWYCFHQPLFRLSPRKLCVQKKLVSPIRVFKFCFIYENVTSVFLAGTITQSRNVTSYATNFNPSTSPCQPSAASTLSAFS